MGIIAKHTAMINRLLRQGKELPDGNREVTGLQAWSQRHLGQWWMAEIVAMAALCLIMVAFAPSTGSEGLTVPTIMVGYSLYPVIAHERGLRWPERDEQREAAARLRELERLPTFEALRARNEWIEGWSVIAAMVGIMASFVTFKLLGIYDDYDPHWLWIGGLTLGLIITGPAVFVVGATLPQGRYRWNDFLAYWSTKYRDPGGKRTGWIVLGCTVLTAVSAPGLLLNLLP